MRSTKTIHVISVHAEGEVGDVIVGGVAPPPGDTIWAQRRWIAQDAELRNFVLNQPRGGVFRHVNLLVPPKDPRAAFISPRTRRRCPAPIRSACRPSVSTPGAPAGYRACAGGAARARHGPRRVPRRHRSRAGPWRGARHRPAGRANHRGGRCRAGLRAPREPGLAPHFLLPVCRPPPHGGSHAGRSTTSASGRRGGAPEAEASDQPVRVFQSGGSPNERRHARRDRRPGLRREGRSPAVD
jgi:hypothetical protein